MSELLGYISIAIAILSYGWYITHTVRGVIKPHAITWLIWSLLNSFVFLEQLLAGAGPGSWVTGAAGVANFAIFLLALKYGERRITRFDWLCLALVGALLVFWSKIADPNVAVLLAITIFLAGLFPTLRKSSRNAHEETALTFGLNGAKFLLALMALQTISLTTALYPLTLFIVNSAFALYLLIARRRQGPPKRRPIKKGKK